MIRQTIGGRCIYKRDSGERVHQNLIYRWLTIESDVLQTIISRRHPEIPALKYIKHLTIAVRNEPNNCCLLGLGGAGVAHTLAPYLQESQFVAVDNNHAVIDIAQQYFFTNRLKNLSIFNQDARLFVAQCKNRYPHLLVDLFDAHSFPEQCNHLDFFIDCQRLLCPNGVLALNLANLNEQWPVFQKIRTVFSNATVVLPVKGTSNMVVLACNHSSVTPLLELLHKQPDLKKLTWDANWGCIAQL